ncbi:MAG: HesA/MoeB/ThiF family protein [bacterium]|nr:HesA/MoeB/ThiF family protein [bacterium]
MLSEQELKRYQRQLGIESWGDEVQDKLKQSRVFIAGVGGLGSSLLYHLTAVGVGTLVIADYDDVDISNLNRQFLHKDRSVGSKKVDSAFDSLSSFNPDIEIIRVYDKLDKKNTGALVGEADLIIDCLDNFKTRHILNRVSVANNIPMIHAGVANFQGQITFLAPPETACLACFFPDKDKKGIFYVTGATAGVMGSLQAVEAIKYLTGIGENLKNKLLFWDGLANRFESVNLRKNPSCKVCGK